MFASEAVSLLDKEAFPVENSVVFNDNDGAELTRGFSAGDQRTWTLSVWVKRANLGTTQGLLACHVLNAEITLFRFEGDNLYFLADYTQTPIRYENLRTSAVYRDPSAWMHIVYNHNTTHATPSERNRLYIDGVRVTDFSLEVYSGKDQTTSAINSSRTHRMFNPPDMYMAEYVFIGGQALLPEIFGEPHPNSPEIWRPRDLTDGRIDYSGVNSCHLDFADPLDIGKDVSGNGNSWTPVNLSQSDVVTDSPSNNVCTLSSIDFASPSTLREGNRVFTAASGSWHGARSTFWMDSGKWYFEAEVLVINTTGDVAHGVATKDHNLLSSHSSVDNQSWVIAWSASSTHAVNGGSTAVLDPAPIAVGQILQFAIDIGTGEIWFGRDGAWFQGDPAAGTGAVFSNVPVGVTPKLGNYSRASSQLIANEDEFTYTPPAGFNALMDKYL